MSEIFGYIGALFIGLILGLTGGGGSILTVPILVYVLLINPVTATAYSLFIVGTTSVFGATQNYFKGLVDVKTGFLFAIPSFTAVYLTRDQIVPRIPDTILETSTILLTKATFLMAFFAIIMIFAAYSMLKKKKETTDKDKKSSVFSLIIQNFIIGIIIGLVGAGGGFLIIPSLVLFAKLPMKKAVGTSLFIIAMNSLIGFMGDVQNLTIDWLFLLKFTSLSIVGIFIGMYLNKFINEKQLKTGFGYFVLAMACFILLKEFYFV
ncbi:sulfite exporter TauE/SafE family protein [uncultured Flavobacterium sp.]|uniref:sulfite exporter TauE/SafE family protein n=1 Tax=uncultured Flavobacterium sp. TaxID=165435 RepID=UPI0030EBC345